MNNYKYEDFHAWWDEVEIFSTRGMRCLESIEQFQSDLGKEANMIVWLQAAFESGRLQNETSVNADV